MTASDTTAHPRERILRAAADLLASGGREAVSTRAVSAAANVQAQTIYRHFGDMQGLLDEVARRGYASYLAAKQDNLTTGDPVDQLRRGWSMHVSFGLANPALYRLLNTDPRPGAETKVNSEAGSLLLRLVTRVAEAGRLRTGVEEAAAMIHAAGVGVTLTLIKADAAGRLADHEGLAERTREAVFGALVTDPDDGPAEGTRAARRARHAVALKALLDGGEQPFTPGEYALLGELLTRLATAAADGAESDSVAESGG